MAKIYRFLRTDRAREIYIIDVLSSIITINNKNNKANCLRNILAFYDDIEDRVMHYKNAMTLLSKDSVIVGDIHGQKYDISRPIIYWLQQRRQNPNINLIFLGDIPDRGNDSIECLYIIFLLILCFDNVFYMRGNHEESLVNQNYGFAKELENLIDNQNKYIILDRDIARILNKSHDDWQSSYHHAMTCTHQIKFM